MASWTLALSDGADTVDFLSTYYKVHDGGFDISLPRSTYNMAEIRQNVYIPVSVKKEYREATISFEVIGASRSAVVTNLNKIERILNNVQMQGRFYSGRRGQLAYAWEGASTKVSYFEVFGGEITFPQDTLSVAKIHLTKDGNYIIPEVKLKLYLAAQGYAISILAGSLTQLQTSYDGSSPSTTAKTINNPGGTSGQNYIQINADQVPGGGPWLTKFELASGVTYSAWNDLYMGLCISPYPTTLVYDDVAKNPDTYLASAVAKAGALGNSVHEITIGANPGVIPSNGFLLWSLTNQALGMFQMFLHSYDQSFTSKFQWAPFIVDNIEHGINWKGDWMAPPSTSSRYAINIGTLRLPGPEMDGSVGTLSPVYVGAAVALGTDPLATAQLDFMSLLPINNGLRLIRARSSNLTGTIIDDAWKGLTYRIKSDTSIAMNVLGAYSPLQLVPNVNQRIYFVSTSENGSTRNRQFDVKVYGTPMFETLAV